MATIEWVGCYRIFFYANEGETPLVRVHRETRPARLRPALGAWHGPDGAPVRVGRTSLPLRWLTGTADRVGDGRSASDSQHRRFQSPSAPASSGPAASAVRIIGRDLVVLLADGRSLSAPLAWFPRLEDAAPASLEGWQLLDGGRGIRWPDLDEDLSVSGLLIGGAQSVPAPTADRPSRADRRVPVRDR